ncbi:hypothetical protein CKM354_000432600 [Cercospora kikuchii]|uniref:C2H2-type domain-containing protein n=1 Tax=Cercospora kikuchii TaxID=84275 RepID=A0A9P3CM73_9PEZI|nr:uncharacterized protein CKM354_000432600 [Cercospora kikuchii]GIZ41008.1 hypothetical protein CKM354_000432600 [Cercospora kikuchii]
MEEAESCSKSGCEAGPTWSQGRLSSGGHSASDICPFTNIFHSHHSTTGLSGNTTSDRNVAYFSLEELTLPSLAEIEAWNADYDGHFLQEDQSLRTSADVLCPLTAIDPRLLDEDVLLQWNADRNLNQEALLAVSSPQAPNQPFSDENAFSPPTDAPPSADRFCMLCEKAFKYPKDFRRHWQSVHESGFDYEYKCPVQTCKYHLLGFARKDNRKRHVRKKHPNFALMLA